MDIKAELRLIREQCQNSWEIITQSEDRPCPTWVGLKSYNIPICFSHGSIEECKECWDEAIEGEGK